jgi:hypothetical protein
MANGNSVQLQIRLTQLVGQYVRASWHMAKTSYITVALSYNILIVTPHTEVANIQNPFWQLLKFAAE